MGQFITRNAQGVPYLFNIAGDQPNPAETDFIQNFMAKGAQTAAPQPPAPEKPGILSLAGSSFMSGVNQIQAGLEDIPQSYFEMTGQPDRAKYWADLAAQDRAEAASYQTADTGVTDASSLGDRGRALVSIAGQSAPSMLASLAAAYPLATAGAAAGSALGPLGTAAGGFAGGVLGVALGMYPQTLEGNVQRQQQEHPNKPIDWEKAHVAAGASAVVEGVSDMTIAKVTGLLGRTALKVAGPELQAMVTKATHNAVGAVAAKYLKEMGIGGMEAALTGAAEETIQQGLERWQADLPLLDKKSQGEYLEAAIQGGLLESVFGATAAGIGTHKEIAHERKLKQLKDDHEAAVAAAQQQMDVNVPANQAAREAPYNTTPMSDEALPSKPTEGQLLLTDQSGQTKEQKYFEAQDNMLPPGLQDGETSKATPPSEKTPEDIAASQIAPNEPLLRTPSPNATVEDLANQTEEAQRKAKTEGVPFVMTNDMRVKLSKLGYNPSEIRAMTPGDAHKIISDGVSKPLKVDAATGQPPLPTELPKTTTADVSHETTPPGTTLKEGEQGPVRKNFGSEQDYRNAIGMLRDYQSVSLDRIQKVLGVKADQAKALFDEMLRRNDAFPAGNHNQYLQITVPHGMETREASDQTGQMVPRRSRDYIVKPVQPANFKPYSIQLNGKTLGSNLKFTTREDAQSYIDNQVPAGKKGKATIAEDMSGMQYGIHELQYQHLPNREQKLVGSKVVNTYATEQEANDALKNYDRAFSPESNKWREQMPVEDRQAAVARDYHDTMGPVGDQLAQHAAQVVGKDRALIAMQPTIASQTNPNAVVEGQAQNLYDNPEGIGRVVRNLITLATDLYDPKLSPEQRTKLLQSVLNHELIHTLRGLDLLTPKEWKMLAEAANRPVPGKLYSWIERANYAHPTLTEGSAQEEAIAEMFRHYVDDPTAFKNPERGLLRKIADFIKKLMGLAKRHNGQDLMDTILGGGVADREIGSGGMGPRTEEQKFYSLLQPDNFYLKTSRFLNDHVKKGEKAKADQWIGRFKNAGIKEDERIWLGLDDWLNEIAKKDHNRSISKEEIENFVNASDSISVETRASKSHPVFGATAVGKPVYKGMQTTGGQDYAEVLFTFKPKENEPFYHHGHWTDHKNMVAHARIKTVMRDGKKYLFIEEIQSDLHGDANRAGGYYSQPMKEDLDRLAAEYHEAVARIGSFKKDHTRLVRERAHMAAQRQRLVNDLTYMHPEDYRFNETRSEIATLEENQKQLEQQIADKAAQMDDLNAELASKTDEYHSVKNRMAIPNAPYRTSWEDYVVKRLMRHAVDHEFDGIAWHGQPESIAQAENYTGLIPQEVDGQTKYYLADRVGGGVYYDRNGKPKNYTTIVNRYLQKIPKIVGGIASKFGINVETAESDYTGKVEGQVGDQPTSFGFSDTIDSHFPDFQSLSEMYHQLLRKQKQESESSQHTSSRQTEQDKLVRMVGRAVQTAKNQGYDFNPIRAFKKAGLIGDAFTNEYEFESSPLDEAFLWAQNGKTWDDVARYRSPSAPPPGFSWRNSYVDFNERMRDIFRRGDLPRYSQIATRSNEVMADPKFQNWFFGSVVTDPDGTPKAQYHYTSSDQPFGRFNRLSHFGTAQAAEGRFKWLGRHFISDTGSTYPVFLNIRRPLDIRDDGSNHNAFSYGLALRDAGIISEDRFNEINRQRFDEKRGVYTKEGEQAALTDIVNEMEKAGYDGFRYINRGEDPGSTSYVTLHPNQIKSINNPGLWSSDPDIMYSQLEQRGADLQENNDKFKHWFANSKVTKPDGTPLLMFHGTSKDKQFAQFKTGGRGAWFTTDPADASMYANQNDSQNIVPDPKPGDPWGMKRTNTASRVAPVFLSIENPYVMTDQMLRDFNNQRGSYQKLQKNLFDQLKQAGYDGVKMGDNTWVAFKPEQVQSALANDFVQPVGEQAYLGKPMYSATAPIGQRVPQNAPLDRLDEIQSKITYDNMPSFLHKIIDYVVPGGERKATAKEMVDSTFINLQDRMLPVGRLVDRIKKNGGFISNENDPYLRQTLYTGQTDSHLMRNEREFYKPFMKAIQDLHVGMSDFNEAKKLSANSRTILMRYAKNPKHAMAELYLYAQHAQERNREMRKRNAVFQKDEHGRIITDANGDPIPVRFDQYHAGSGMEDGEAQHILDWFASKPFGTEFNSETNPNSVRSHMRALVNNTNDVRVAGDLTPDFRRMNFADGTPVNVYRDYVPLRGLDQENTYQDADMASFAKTGKGFNIRGKEDFNATGRASLATDIIAHAVLQNQESVVRAGKNTVTKSFRQLILDNPAEFAGGMGKPKIAEILDAPPTKYQFDKARGVVTQRQDLGFYSDPTILKGKYNNGQQFFIKLYDDRLIKAFNASTGLGNVSMGGVIKTLTALNRVMAITRTSMNPEFTFNNLLRDLSTALVNLSEYEIKGIRRQVVADILPTLKGVAKAIRSGDMTTEMGKLYDEFQRYGGQTAVFGIRDLEDAIHKMNKAFDEDPSGAMHKVKKPIKAIGDFIENYNLAIENSTRLATYKALRDKYLELSGDPTNPVNQKRAKEMAAFASKNMTVNFNMGGEYKGLMSALYLFYNASLQGSMALLNPFIRSRKMKKVWGTVLLAGLAQDLLMSMLSPTGDDGKKKYDRIPDFVLEHNMVFIDPFGLTKSGYIHIPLPYLMNGIFNWGRSLGRTMRGEYSMGQFMKSGGMTMLDSLNPWGGSNSFLNFVAPSVLDPVVDLAQNEDWTGKPIAPPVSPYDHTGINRSQQFWNNTNPAFVTIADWMSRLTGRSGDYIPGYMEYSPNQVEYVWDFLAGGTGTFISRGVGLATSAYKGEVPNVGDIPFVRSFTGSVTSKNDMQAYIAGRDQVMRVRNSLQSARKDGNNDQYMAIMRQYPNEYKAAAKINSIENARVKLSTKIKHIQDSANLSDEEKAKRVKMLRDRQDKLVGEGNKVMSDYGV